MCSASAQALHKQAEHLQTTIAITPGTLLSLPPHIAATFNP
jgi:hypothetical protein